MIKNFKQWLEAREISSGFDINNIDPIKKEDEFRVYHGFYNVNDAVNIALHGTSGKITTKRVYSYESENNPKGLFVTLNIKTAKKFAAGIQPVVMQFVAKENELQPPTWPGNSWTGQGQMAQYFYQHPKGAKLGRIEKIKQDQEEAKKSSYKAISQSNRPELANILFGSEMQALFVGDLNSNRIEGFYVQRKQKEYLRVDDPWEFLSTQQFIKEFKDNFNYKATTDERSQYRIFMPDQEFNWQQMAKYFNDKYKKNLNTEEDVYRFLKDALVGNFKITMKRDNFESIFSQYFWPKQLPKLHRWMVKMYRKFY